MISESVHNRLLGSDQSSGSNFKLSVIPASVGSRRECGRRGKVIFVPSGSVTGSDICGPSVNLRPRVHNPRRVTSVSRYQRSSSYTILVDCCCADGRRVSARMPTGFIRTYEPRKRDFQRSTTRRTYGPSRLWNPNEGKRQDIVVGLSCGPLSPSTTSTAETTKRYDAVAHPSSMIC